MLKAEELVRPETIDLLISHREGCLVPQPFKMEGNLVLWDSRRGKTVGSTHPNLSEEVDLTPHLSETHFAKSMRTCSQVYRDVRDYSQDLDEDPTRMENVILSNTMVTNKDVLEWFKWDSIGTPCDPRCGS